MGCSIPELVNIIIKALPRRTGPRHVAPALPHAWPYPSPASPTAHTQPGTPEWSQTSSLPCSLNINTWADLTTRAPDGMRFWLDIASLLPALILPAFLPTPRPWPGDLDASRPGEFWRLTRCHDEWAWGGIYQILCAHPDNGKLSTHRRYHPD